MTNEGAYKVFMGFSVENEYMFLKQYRKTCIFASLFVRAIINIFIGININFNFIYQVSDAQTTIDIRNITLTLS